MLNGGYQFKQMTDNIVLLYGFQNECNMYVLNGSERLLLVDTGMGTGDLKAALAAIAPGKPCVVVNTHGHSDHCCGNSQFPSVFLHPLAYADADFAEEEKKTLPTDREVEGIVKYDWEKRPLREGDPVELGDRALEVIETPGHTPGCICLLDKTDRILFGGDLFASGDHCIHMLDHVGTLKFSTVSIETLLRSLRKLDARRDEFDWILAGHDAFLMGKEYLDWAIRMCEKVLDGSADSFHPQLPPLYGDTVCWKVEEGNSAMLYQDETIFDGKAEKER